MKGRILSVLCLAAVVVAMTSTDALPVTSKVNVYGMGGRELAGLKVTLNWLTKWTTSGGSHSVATGTKVYLSGLIDSGTASTFAWTMTAPTGSTTTLDSASKWRTSFTADSAGQYLIGLTVNGVACVDTIWAGSYVGVGTITDTSFTAGTAGAKQCGNCHNTDGPGSVKIPGWATTAHAQRLKWDLTGKIVSHGASYSDPSCTPCHSTGYNTSSTAGGFFELWQGNAFTSPDSTKKGKMFDTAGVMWSALSAPMKQLGGVTCESCHGPYLAGHNNKHLNKTADASVDVCAQCHDKLPSQPNIYQWGQSGHGTMPKTNADAIKTASCMQCHSGTGFIKYVKGKATGAAAAVYTASDALQPIGCSTCHDPHNANNNERMLRIAKMDTLGNGWAIDFGGKGQLCMNCHRSRRGNATAYVAVKHPGRLDPHGNPQTDMLAGRNAAYIDTASASISEGVNTHKHLDDACVTCHMQASPTNAPNAAGGHTWKMSGKDTSGKSFDQVGACKTCHGAEVVDFHSFQASRDFDGNGKVEDVQREVKGLLTKLGLAIQAYDTKHDATLPAALDSTGAPKADSLLQFDVYVRTAIYNWYFVTNDGSRGIHNAKYAFNLLTTAIANLSTPSDVQQMPGQANGFALEGNYPNPFNPSTTLRFSIPERENVRLTIYDMNGAAVRVLVSGPMYAGRYETVWDGKDAVGQQVSSGVYMYRLQSGTNTASGRMLLMK